MTGRNGIEPSIKACPDGKVSVLSIGDDIGIAESLENASLKRHLEYAQRCRRYIGLCYTAPGFRPRHIGENFHLFPTNTRYFCSFLFDALILGIRLIKRFKPQVIVAQDALVFGLAGWMLKKISGVPLVIHYHSGFWTNPYWLSERRINRALAGLGRFVTGRADIVRTVSTDIRERLIQKGFEPDRVFYATPPVESGPFLRDSREQEERILSRHQLNPSKTFLFVGRLSREKNLPLMLRAISTLAPNHPDLKLMIVGKGPERGALQELASRLEIEGRVVFAGAVPNGELNGFMRASCALLISSYYEGTAKVLKEAGFAGRPTITTKTSGVSDAVINGETGYVIPIGDESALAGAIKTFIENPGKASRMGERAREYMIETFNYRKDLDHLVRVWKTAALKGRRS